MRLDKFLSDSTGYSRSDVKKLVREGRITVNGEAAKKSDASVKETDTVGVDGTRVEYCKYAYLILNKPAGYVSAVRDKHYPAVTELIPSEYAHFNMYPIGRLDRNTEGLLILTNDGDLTHMLTSPNKNVCKRYFARLDAPAEESDKAIFAAGIQLKDFTAKPARLEICENPTEVYVEVSEGKFHQVRRMCARVGKNVLYLKRTAIGGLTLPPELMPGEVMPTTREKLESEIFGTMWGK